MSAPVLAIDWRSLPNAPVPGTSLGSLTAFVPGAIREFCFEEDPRDPAFRMLVFRHGDTVHGYVNQCPHHWLRMNRSDGTFLRWSDCEIMCMHHSAVFDLLDAGACRMGPCLGSNMVSVPLALVEGRVEVGAAGVCAAPGSC